MRIKTQSIVQCRSSTRLVCCFQQNPGIKQLSSQMQWKLNVYPGHLKQKFYCSLIKQKLIKCSLESVKFEQNLKKWLCEGIRFAVFIFFYN